MVTFNSHDDDIVDVCFCFLRYEGREISLNLHQSEQGSQIHPSSSPWILKH